MKNSTKPKVALFVESHEGFGHFNIVSQLARELEAKGAEVMVLSGTLDYAGAKEAFDFGDSRIVDLPLVDYRIVDKGKWEYITKDGINYDQSPEVIKERKSTIEKALEEFKPDLVLTELFPFMQLFRKHDIEAVDELYKESDTKPQKVCLCRDIIHNSNPQLTLDLLDKHYDRLLVRGDERFVKLAESQADWSGINLPTEYMGNYITAMPERDATIKDEDRPVVVFGGGGYYEKDLPFFESIIRSRKLSEKFSGRRWDIYISENANKHMVNDPSDAEGKRKITAFDYLKKLAEEEGQGMISVLTPIDSEKFRNELTNAAVAISRGGYNTTFELLAAKQPQVVVPRVNKEQVQRANRLSKNGIANIYPEYPISKDIKQTDLVARLQDTESLAKVIDKANQITKNLPDYNNHGAATTAETIVELIKNNKDQSKTGWTDRTSGSSGLALSR